MSKINSRPNSRPTSKADLFALTTTPQHSPQASRYSEGFSFDLSTPKSEKSTSSAMLDAKYTRKKAENDLQLLTNRIALLKLEEQKALEKVRETKDRATEILE